MGYFYLTLLLKIILVLKIFGAAKNNVTYAIEWSDLKIYSTVGDLLVDIPAGSIKAGRLLGIIGPSGSGKTTFLKVINSLAQGLSPPPGLRVHGYVSISNSDDLVVGYVYQDDSFFSALTVKETLTFSHLLRGAQKDVSRSIDKLLQTLGLLKVQNNLIGDSLDNRSGGRMRRKSKSGGGGDRISGGERKRLSVGCEMILGSSEGSNAKLLLLDEPTSGLDAFQAKHTVNLVKELVRQEGQLAAVMTIHQPRGTLWDLLDGIVSCYYYRITNDMIITNSM